MSSIKPSRLFALADCNNFYASCEQMFNPLLEKKPLLILSNNDGCVIARSQKAKAIGVKMGDPAYLYREKADRGEINMLSSNFALYADLSQRVMQTLSTFSPDMEIYSIDEAFFLLEQRADLAEEAAAIRRKVKQWTGIPVSIGIGPTKTLAKIANEIAKKEPQGVLLLSEPETIRNRLERTACKEIWGIGSGLSEKLKKKGIHTAAQLADADDVWIQKLLGVSGYRTVLELRGTPCILLSEEPEKRKSIVCSRSFRDPLTELSSLQEAIAEFVTRACEKLREQESQAGFLSVFLATSPFRESYVSNACHVQIPCATSYTPDLISLAKEGLARIFKAGLQYKKAGVLLGDLSDADTHQPDLLALSMDSEKKRNAMEALDRINARYDKSAIRFAAAGVGKNLKSARSSVSPRFTTSWQELLIIR